MPTETAIKSRGIIFTGQSVPQIQSDLKTMTRRLVKPQPEYDQSSPMPWVDMGPSPSGAGRCGRSLTMEDCPYTVGMLLWVKETWRPLFDGEDWYVEYRADGGTWQPSDPDAIKAIILAARSGDDMKLDNRWRSPKFMPRKLSRLTLEVIGVGLERVQEISEADAKLEGIDPLAAYPRVYRNALFRSGFANVWDSLHAKPKPVKHGGKIVRYESFPWEEGFETREHRGLPHLVYGNPVVFPITFKRVEQRQDGGGR